MAEIAGIIAGMTGGIAILVLGLLFALRSRPMVRLQVWNAGTLLGAKFIPSEKTYNV